MGNSKSSSSRSREGVCTICMCMVGKESHVGFSIYKLLAVCTIQTEEITLSHSFQLMGKVKLIHFVLNFTHQSNLIIYGVYAKTSKLVEGQSVVRGEHNLPLTLIRARSPLIGWGSGWLKIHNIKSIPSTKMNFLHHHHQDFIYKEKLHWEDILAITRNSRWEHEYYCSTDSIHL